MNESKYSKMWQRVLQVQVRPWNDAAPAYVSRSSQGLNRPQKEHDGAEFWANTEYDRVFSTIIFSIMYSKWFLEILYLGEKWSYPVLKKNNFEVLVLTLWLNEQLFAFFAVFYLLKTRSFEQKRTFYLQHQLAKIPKAYDELRSTIVFTRFLHTKIVFLAPIF